ncbi:hypothetical protein [Shinella sp.]|uniref:hypothetical protein n=1 Tax=Shinella sp. TaxID=1870904 RepID=UPI00289A246E|nr:hypothetical protein [Shinella sp.]
MNEFVAITILAALVGAAIGASLAKTAPWKGAVAVFVGVIASGTLSYALGIENVIISVACLIIAAGITGSALKMRPPQIGHAVLGSFLAVAIVYFVVDAIRYAS